MDCGRNDVRHGALFHSKPQFNTSMETPIYQSKLSPAVLEQILNSKCSLGDYAKARRYLRAVVYPNDAEVAFLARMFAACRLDKGLRATIGSKLDVEKYDSIEWVLSEVKINCGKSTR